MIGLVVYVGSDTKVMRNTQKRIFKFSKLEQKMHKIILLILLVLFILIFFISIFYIIKEKQDNY